MTRETSKDPRLLDIVAIPLCAVIGGAQSWVDIERYGQSKQNWFAPVLSLPNGSPSDDPFARVVAQLEPEQMQQCFLSWIEAISQLSAGEVIA